jgi:hypothetical protein
MFAYRNFSRLLVVVVVTALVAALAPVFSRAEAAGGGVLTYGDVGSGQISDKAYFELWSFEGQEGDRINITMTGDGKLDPYLGLIESASEQVLVEDDDSAGNSNAMIETTLPSSGVFIIVATRYNFDQGDSAGAYEVQLAGGTGPQTNVNTGSPEEVSPGVFYMGDIQLATETPGAISNDSYAQLYSVQLEAGTNFAVGMFANNSTVDPYVIFANEAGDVLAEDDDSGVDIGGGRTDAYVALTVEETGSYIIVATRSGVDTGKSTGDYILIAGVPEEQQPDPVSDDNEMPEGVAYMGDLALGSSGSGAISSTEYIHLYTFEGEAGEQVTITMVGDGGLDAYLGLIDPNDEVIAEDDDSGGGTNAQISIRLPESGTYIIVVTRNGLDQGASEGNYTLDLISGTPEAPEGVSGFGGFGGLPGRAFPGEENTLYLRGTGASDNPEKATGLESLLGSEEGMPGRQ